MEKLIDLFNLLSSVSFWEGLFLSFRATGPAVAFLLAMMESFVPALPLTAIAALNVTAYGFADGFLLTWGGSCVGCTITFLFFRYLYRILSRKFSRSAAGNQYNAKGNVSSCAGHFSDQENSFSCTNADPDKRISSSPDKKKKNSAEVKIEKAQEWISGFDTTALFLLLCLPFTPSSFMNFAFGISDFPIRKYLITLFLAKVIMIGSLAFFGDSLGACLQHPAKLTAALMLMLGLYLASVYMRKKHNLQ